MPEKGPSIPTPPSWMSRRAKAVWRRLAPVLHKTGLLTEADVDSFASYCTAVGQMQEAEQRLKKEERVLECEKRGCYKNAWVLVLKDAQAVIATMASRFGLTPSDRARIDLGDRNGPKDDWGEF